MWNPYSKGIEGKQQGKKACGSKTHTEDVAGHPANIIQDKAEIGRTFTICIEN